MDGRTELALLVTELLNLALARIGNSIRNLAWPLAFNSPALRARLIESHRQDLNVRAQPPLTLQELHCVFLEIYYVRHPPDAMGDLPPPIRRGKLFGLTGPGQRRLDILGQAFGDDARGI